MLVVSQVSILAVAFLSLSTLLPRQSCGLVHMFMYFFYLHNYWLDASFAQSTVSILHELDGKISDNCLLEQYNKTLHHANMMHT